MSWAEITGFEIQTRYAEGTLSQLLSKACFSMPVSGSGSNVPWMLQTRIQLITSHQLYWEIDQFNQAKALFFYLSYAYSKTLFSIIRLANDGTVNGNHE